MRIRVLMMVLAASLLPGLAACGASGGSTSGGSSHGASSPAVPSAASLAHDAKIALSTAQSVKFQGTVSENSQAIHLNLGFTGSGAVSGSITGPIAGTHLALNVIVIGKTAYFLIDKQYFNSVFRQHGAPASACATYCGKYLKEPAKQLRNLRLPELTAHLFSSGTIFSGAVTTATIDGQPAYRIRDNKGDYLFVTKAAPHRPIEVTKPGNGTVVFSEWNSVPPISAPPASKIVDLSGRTSAGT